MVKDIEDIAEKKLVGREMRRQAKKRKRMPVHGAGLKKVGQLWHKRLKGK